MSAPSHDKTITREIHKLFWQANFQSKSTLIVCYVTRICGYVLIHTLTPLISALAIQAIITRHFEKVHHYVFLVLVFTVCYFVLWAIGNYMISLNAIKGSRYIQHRVFANFLSKDYDFYGNSFFGSLGAQADRMRDLYNNYGEIVTHSIPKQIAIVVSGISIIAYSSVQLAVVTFFALVFVLSFTVGISKWRLSYRRKVSKASNDIAAHVGDALTHGTAVKSFAMEDFELSRMNEPLNSWSRAQFISWNLATIAESGRTLLAGATTALLLLLSSNLYQQNKIGITLVVLIQLYVIRLVATTLEIAEIVKRYEEVMGAAYEPIKTMLVTSTVTDPVRPKHLPAKSEHLVELKNVSFGYAEARSNLQAISNFSLVIKPGEKIGIVGYSGSGKTTLTKLLLRFMDVTSGSIMIDGIDIRDLTQKELRTLISYVPQEPLLFHRTIAENITYAVPTASRAQMKRAAALAYVDEFAKDLPLGYNTLVGERGIKLSGGQRQRVAIARALLKDSRVLVLDEATSALDSKSEKYIQDALWELMKDRTALVIAHRLSTIQRMDKIIVIDGGKIVQTGTHAKLKVKPGIYAELWKHQSGGYIGLPKLNGDDNDK
jgi:ATP-binding cassette subfamily B protein